MDRSERLGEGPDPSLHGLSYAWMASFPGSALPADGGVCPETRDPPRPGGR